MKNKVAIFGICSISCQLIIYGIVKKLLKSIFTFKIKKEEDIIIFFLMVWLNFYVNLCLTVGGFESS